MYLDIGIITCWCGVLMSRVMLKVDKINVYFYKKKGISSNKKNSIFLNGYYSRWRGLKGNIQ